MATNDDVSCRQLRQCMNQCLIGTFVQTIGLRVIRAADAMLNSGTLVQNSVEKAMYIIYMFLNER